MAKHNEIGKQGEDIACKYLKTLGYDIVERNMKIRNVEIDIIARLGNVFAFVEVKTRSTAVFGSPSDAVDVRKQQRMIKAASAFLADVKEDCEYRFDIASVVLENGVPGIRYIKDAFIAF